MTSIQRNLLYMPALSIKRFCLSTCFCLLIFVSGCSREEFASGPEAYVAQPTAFCTDDSPFDFQLLESVSRGLNAFNLFGDSNAVFNYEQYSYEPSVNYLIDSFVLIPKHVDKDEPLVKKLTTSMLDRLSGAQANTLISSKPILEKVTIKVSQDTDGDVTNKTIDEENASQVISLLEGLNIITIDVVGSIRVSYSGLECTTTDGAGDDVELDTATRLIQVEQSYTFEINRSRVSGFTQLVLPQGELAMDSGDEFGRNLAITDKYLAVGVPLEDGSAKGIFDDISGNQNNDALDSGAVYLYAKNDSNEWVFSHYIKSSNSETGDQFGYSVSLNGEILIVSALGEDSLAEGIYSSETDESKIESANVEKSNLAESSGAVYVFKHSTVGGVSDWNQVGFIKPSSNLPGDNGYQNGFGSMVLFDGKTLVISAPNEDSRSGDPNDSSRPNSGAVFVYSYSNDSNTFEYSNMLKSNAADEGDLFGQSIALQENKIVVGSPNEDSKTTEIINEVLAGDKSETDDPQLDNSSDDSGAVYVFSLSNNFWDLSSYIKPSNGEKGDKFGSAVAISNNMIAVSSAYEDGGGLGLNREIHSNTNTDSGAVYIYGLSNETIWIETAYIKANDAQEKSLFGSYIGFNDNTLLVSAPNFDSDIYQGIGKAYMYSVDENQWKQELEFNEFGLYEGMKFGQSIAISPRHFVIGSSGFTNNGNDKAGNAYSYE